MAADFIAHNFGRRLERVVDLFLGQGALDFRLQFLGVALHELLRLGPAEPLGLGLEVIEQALGVLGRRNPGGVLFHRDGDLPAGLRCRGKLGSDGRRYGGHLLRYAGLHEGLRVNEYLLHRAGLGGLRDELFEGLRVTRDEFVGLHQLVEVVDKFRALLRTLGAFHGVPVVARHLDNRGRHFRERFHEDVARLVIAGCQLRAGLTGCTTPGLQSEFAGRPCADAADRGLGPSQQFARQASGQRVENRHGNAALEGLFTRCRHEFGVVQRGMNRHRVGAIHALLGHYVLQRVAVLHGEAAQAGARGRATRAEHGTTGRAHQGRRTGAERLQRGFQHGARVGANRGKGVAHGLRVADVLHALGNVIGHRVALDLALLLGQAHGQFDGRVVADAMRCGCCRPLPFQALEDAHLIEQQGQPSAPLGEAALHRLGDVAQEAALDGGHAGQVVVGNLGALDVRQ